MSVARAVAGARVVALAVLLLTVTMLVLEMTTDSLTFGLLPPFYLIAIGLSTGLYVGLILLIQLLEGS